MKGRDNDVRKSLKIPGKLRTAETITVCNQCLHKGLFVPGNWSASQCDRQWIDLKIPQKERKRKMEMKLCTHTPKTHLQ